MSEARAIAKYIRISPRKVRQVIDLIRGKKVGEALAILKFTPKRAAEAIEKVVKSAAANAENNLELNKDELYISEAYVDQGPTLKRMNPRAMGRADLMRRRTSHITVIVGQQEEAQTAPQEELKAKKTTRKPSAAKKEAAAEPKATTAKATKAEGETKKVTRKKKEG